MILVELVTRDAAAKTAALPAIPRVGDVMTIVGRRGVLYRVARVHWVVSEPHVTIYVELEDTKEEP